MCTQLYGFVTSSTDSSLRSTDSSPARKIIRIVLKKFAHADFRKMNMSMHEMMRKMRKMMKMNMNMHADFIKMQEQLHARSLESFLRNQLSCAISPPWTTPCRGPISRRGAFALSVPGSSRRTVLATVRWSVPRMTLLWNIGRRGP